MVEVTSFTVGGVKFSKGDTIEPKIKQKFVFEETIIAFGKVSYFYTNTNGEKIDSITKLKNWKIKESV